MGNHPPFMPINTWLSCIEVGRFAIESFTSVLNTLRTSKIFELSSPVLLFIIASIVRLNLDIFGSKGSFFVYSYNKIGHFLIISMQRSLLRSACDIFWLPKTMLVLCLHCLVELHEESHAFWKLHNYEPRASPLPIPTVTVLKSSTARNSSRIPNFQVSLQSTIGRQGVGEGPTHT